MAKSRKVLLALALLAGGYGLALSFNSLTAAIARWTGGGTDRETVGVLVPLEPAAPPAATTTLAPTAAAMVPSALHEPVPLSSELNPPTWLVAAQEIDASEPSTEPPTRGALARVKDVTPWGPTASSGASPWDRWPAWEPLPTKSNPPPDSPTRPASYESASGEPPSEVAAAPDDQDSIERRHIVVDGDSLARLADRYLDDPQLADEIFRRNRNVLNDPDLLPIGVELVIPDRRVATIRRSQADASVAEAAPLKAPAPFVLFEQPAEPVHNEPRAHLLGPLPIGHDQ